jgi:hypothetical protein
MAVRKVATIDRWIGLSTDTKPTSARVGSTFKELDSGKDFVWSGIEWKQDLSMMYAVKMGMLGMPTEPEESGESS